MAEITLIVCYLAACALFWLPGSLLARRLLRDRNLPAPFMDLAALAIGGVAAYLAFWVYLVHPLCGRAFSWLVCGSGVAGAVVFARGRVRRIGELFSVPVRVAGLLGLLYLGAITLFGGVDRTPTHFVPGACADSAASYFWLTPRSIDSLIPLKFAEAVGTGGPLRGEAIRFPEWSYSDRPPLQTGLLLLFWPFARLVGYGVLGQAVGVLAQVTCFMSLLAFAWAAGFGHRRATYILACLAGSGFVYFSCVYVWPKFFAATFWFMALAPLVLARRRQQAPTAVDTVLAGAGSALSMLAHGSIAFSLLPLALWAACYRPFWRMVLPGGAVALALYAPWAAYQKFVDPPGDRCAKYSLAAAANLDDGQSTWSSLRASYAELTVKQLLENRRQNFMLLFGDVYLDRDIGQCLAGMRDPALKPAFFHRYYLPAAGVPATPGNLAALLRYDQVEQTFRALGILNLGWPILLWQVIHSRGRCLRRRGRGPLLSLTLGALALWWLLVYEPGLLIIRGCSHAMLLGLFVLAAAAAGDAPRPVRYGLLALHLAVNAVLWVLLVPTGFAREHLHLAGLPQLVPLVACLVALAALGVHARRGRLAYADRLPRTGGDPAAGGGPWWAAAWTAGLVLLVGASVPGIWRHRLRVEAAPAVPPDWRSTLQVAGASRVPALFDGITHDQGNFGMAPLFTPVTVTLPEPLRLRELRLHLFDFDNRVYLFYVEGRTGDRWTMLMDSSRQLRSGEVRIPLRREPYSAFRIVGLYNSDVRWNPANQVLHIKEVELVPE